MKHVCIGIQARSTSSRFPNKIFEPIQGKEMLKHVVDAVDKSQYYLNRNSHRSGFTVSYAILCPKGDPLKEKYKTRSKIIEGDEFDVLSRYVEMARALSADYIVRVTGDCPMLPPYLITKHVKLALANEYDYVSNVDEQYRTSIDGHDVEVFTKSALDWADEHAKEPRDREHVTTVLRTSAFSENHKCGLVVNHLNQSHIKLSVDTHDDLEHVRIENERLNKILESARIKFGKNHVHQV